MNPRRRRNIARAIIAGVDPTVLNTKTLENFLRSEGANLNVTEEEISEVKADFDLVEDTDTTTDVVVTETTTTDICDTPEDIAPTILTDKITETTSADANKNSVATKTTKKTTKKTPNALKSKLSLSNTRTQLATAAEKLGIEVKSSMSKRKILDAIEKLV